MLADFERVVLAEPLKATLRLLSKLLREHSVTTDDIRGLSPMSRLEVPSASTSLSA